VTASSPEDPIADAAAAALSGGLVVIPTDTVYGVGTRPDDPAATRALFVVKGRPRDLGIPVLVASSAEAEEAAVLDDRARLLAARFWPGPLSLVLPRTDRSRGWDLGGDATTIAVRIPRHPLALAVLSRTGPLAVTSANRSGEPTPATLDGVRASLGDAGAGYLGGGRPRGRPGGGSRARAS
jgi:L-threonylcarbamoyladenylate synthase